MVELHSLIKWPISGYHNLAGGDKTATVLDRSFQTNRLYPTVRTMPSEVQAEYVLYPPRFGAYTHYAALATSRMLVILNPTLLSARNASPRPEPGPFTKTANEPSHARAPCYPHPLQQAVPRMAYFSRPLNPRDPADDHDTALPCTSVMVIIVLLKVAWM